MAGINSGEVKGRAARFFGNKVCSLFRKTSLDFTAVHENEDTTDVLSLSILCLESGGVI